MWEKLKLIIKTFVFFLIALLLLPVLLLTSVFVRYTNKLTNYILTLKYPTLIISKSNKIRSLIDTPRNAGIFHFLLRIKGPCDFQQIKQKYLENLLEQRDKFGLLKFLKLRQTLITCWGHYAWVKDTSLFNVNNHILMSSANYRGRPVNESNIEEFVSELVTKYMPSDRPQWQVIVIPLNKTEIQIIDYYYILVRVHHLIIAEEPDLHISELLMLQSTDGKQCLDLFESNQSPKWQQLSHFIREPIYIETLYRHFRNFIIKQWNSFIYEFDSLDLHDDCHVTVTVNNISKLFCLLIIISVNVCSNFWATIKLKNWQQQKQQRIRFGKQKITKHQLFKKLLVEEIEKRQLTWHVVLTATKSTLHPLNLTYILLKLLRYIIVTPLAISYYIIQEILILITMRYTSKRIFTNTYYAQISFCSKLILNAMWEFIKMIYEVYKAPINIYEELFEKLSDETNILQMKSYSGRKIVSFSKSIDAADIRKRILFGKNVHECDFALSCLAGAIRDYFALYETAAVVPSILNTTCRTMSKGYFTDRESDKFDYIGGVVFLQLPLNTPDLAHAMEIHKTIEDIRKKQTIIYLAAIGQTKFDLLTALLPQVVTKVFINFFSYNFPVTITDIHGTSADFKTIWGQDVEDVLLFRPPQSKTCLSLNLHRFGDKYRLAVMADTQLGPDHTKISRAFEYYMTNSII